MYVGFGAGGLPKVLRAEVSRASHQVSKPTFTHHTKPQPTSPVNTQHTATPPRHSTTPPHHHPPLAPAHVPAPARAAAGGLQEGGRTAPNSSLTQRQQPKRKGGAGAEDKAGGRLGREGEGTGGKGGGQEILRLLSASERDPTEAPEATQRRPKVDPNIIQTWHHKLRELDTNVVPM